MNSLEALVRSAAAGNDRAFAGIIRRFQDMAFGYAYSILGDLQLAEDAAQEAFIEAYINLKKLDDPSAFPGWFRKIVQFRSNRFMQRKQLPQAPLEEAVARESKEPGPHELAVKREIEETVFAAVNSLSRPLREATTLFYINGYSRKEIADFLEISEHTVRNRLNASRKELKRRLTMNGIIKETFGSNKPGDEFVRKVIEGVPKVKDNIFQETNENNELSMTQLTEILSNLCSSLESLGEDYGITKSSCSLPLFNDEKKTQKKAMCINNLYMFLSCTSGAAFRLVWNPGKWDIQINDLLSAAPEPLEPVSRAFVAAGYSYEAVGNSDFFKGKPDRGNIFRRYENLDFLKDRIVRDIRENKPVIAWDDNPFFMFKYKLITGYDESADVLICWNLTQSYPAFKDDRYEVDQSGYFRQHAWCEKTPGLLFIGERKIKSELREIYKSSLQWAVQLARTENIAGGKGGLAAYQYWMEDLLNEDFFQTNDGFKLLTCLFVNHHATRMIWEGRWYAAHYLKQISDSYPKLASDLLKACECYLAISDLVPQAWADSLSFGFDFTGENAKIWAKTENRKKLIPIIQQMRDKDEEAIGIIEKVLEKW